MTALGWPSRSPLPSGYVVLRAVAKPAKLRSRYSALLKAKPAAAPQGQVGFDGGHHGCASGHGCASRGASDIHLGVVGGHVDASMPQDQANLVERDAIAQHLRRRGVPQQMCAFGGP